VRQKVEQQLVSKFLYGWPMAEVLPFSTCFPLVNLVVLPWLRLTAY